MKMSKGTRPLTQAGLWVQTVGIQVIHQPKLFYLNMFLHLALVVFHILLLTYEVEHQSGSQHKTHFATLLYWVMEYVIDCVAKVCSLSIRTHSPLNDSQAYQPVLTFFTQGLALRRIVKTANTLSTLHDQSGAWLGMIPAMLSLCHQIRLRTAPVGITLIVLYYCLIFLLGYTTARYFDFGTRYNNTLLGNTTWFMSQLSSDEYVPILLSNLFCLANGIAASRLLSLSSTFYHRLTTI